jgi:hypothetical protein
MGLVRWKSERWVEKMTELRLFCVLLAIVPLYGESSHLKMSGPQFQTSDRCQACHNGMETEEGSDASIGFHWRASIMANSSRDPYWQASVRREVIDHPESQSHIEDECSICHMPITRYEAKLQGKQGEIFAHLPLNRDPEGRKSSDGVSCSVCHQIARDGLGTSQSYNGGFVVHGGDAQGRHSEYGPFKIDPGLQTVMRSSSEGYRPSYSEHIRDSALCGTCHTLITNALGTRGKAIGSLHEQMPYLEWLQSDYREKQSCQTCHMPDIKKPVQISKVLGTQREGARLHSFVGGNFLMLEMLNRFRNELDVSALPAELNSNILATKQFLQTEAASLEIQNISYDDHGLTAVVYVHNRDGHKLPTAYPARRAWLHISIQDPAGKVVFESGALKPDGSIDGNDNDCDGSKFEPHYSEIQSSAQVQIYESILGDDENHVTTGLLAGTHYLKDNRLLPDGFDKAIVDDEIQVVGQAKQDEDFKGGGDKVRYSVALSNSKGPFRVVAELLFQPIGFRWAHNFDKYRQINEISRFVGYYDDLRSNNAWVLATASAVTQR